MTILEAITVILNKEGQGLPCKEITNRILSENLYTFNTPDPSAVVRQCLRRHCQGLDFASAHPVKCFCITSGNRGTAVYNLLSKAPNTEPLPKPKKSVVFSSSDLLPEEKMQLFYEEHRYSVKKDLLNIILSNDPSFLNILWSNSSLHLDMDMALKQERWLADPTMGVLTALLARINLASIKFTFKPKDMLPQTM